MRQFLIVTQGVMVKKVPKVEKVVTVDVLGLVAIQEMLLLWG